MITREIYVTRFWSRSYMAPLCENAKYFQSIVENVMPKSELVRLPKTNHLKTRKRLNGFGDSESEDEDVDPDLDDGDTTNSMEPQPFGTEKVRIFLPSSWAKLDVATSVVFNAMFPCFYNGEHSPRALESSAIVQERPSFADTCDRIFVNSNGEQRPCKPGTSIEVSVQSEEVRSQNSFFSSVSEDKYVLHATIAATWCIGSERGGNPSVQRALSMRTLSPEEKRFIMALSTARVPSHVSGTDSSRPLPGDICTLLRPERGQSDELPILLHRIWKHDDGVPSVTLIWARLRNEASNRSWSPNERGTIDVFESQVVEDIRVYTNANGSSDTGHPAQGYSDQAELKPHGTLADGTRFVIYRMLLYCDDFQKSSAMSPKGSAGGCYFLPLSLPPEARRNTSSVRIISLTPPGVSTNDVLHFIVEDLVNAIVRGVEGHTPMGERVKIFIVVVGFVGDYPASASVVDISGHICGAPCTLCTFRRLEPAAAKRSRFGYTTKVHAGNSAFMRHYERQVSLRESSISDEDAVRIGMVRKEKYSDRKCPLLYLQRTLQTKLKLSGPALTSTGRPVVPGIFDAYRCNLVAPDHLLTGLAKDILNAVFTSLPSQKLRIEVDIYICAALRDNGLLQQRNAFNIEKKKLHSMTLSELFCVVLVSVPTLKQLVRQCPPDHIIHECVLLLQQLQRLIALTYWWPERDLDGNNAVSLVHRNKDTYFSDLKALSKTYIEAVDNICEKSEKVKKHLDKPNIHRLLELYEHTLPAFGHVREFMELVFESAHQPLKRCISRSNNHNAHVFAVEHCVGNDWQGRLSALVRDISHEIESTRTAARRGLRRSLLGEQADMLGEEEHNDLIAVIDPYWKSFLHQP